MRLEFPIPFFDSSVEIPSAHGLPRVGQPAIDMLQRLALALESEWRHLLVRQRQQRVEPSRAEATTVFCRLRSGYEQVTSHYLYFGGVTGHSVSASPPAIASGFTRGHDFLATLFAASFSNGTAIPHLAGAPFRVWVK